MPGLQAPVRINLYVERCSMDALEVLCKRHPDFAKDTKSSLVRRAVNEFATRELAALRAAAPAK